MSILNGSLENIYLKHRQQLFTVALSITKCPDRAEDAIHNAFQRLFRLGSIPGNLKVYVFKSVRNAAIDQYRLNSRPTTEITDYIIDPGDGPVEKANEKEFEHSVNQALLKLSEMERETIVDHLYADLTFKEIARILGIPRSTVVSCYYRGIKKLRALLEVKL